MKIALKVSFQEKDAVKQLAKDNGTQINWSAPLKTWYWEGDRHNIPECLKPYLDTPAGRQQQNPSGQTYYAIGQRGSGRFPFLVEEIYTSKEALLDRVEQMINTCDSHEDALFLSVRWVAQLTKKIRIEKHAPVGIIKAYSKLDNPAEMKSRDIGTRAQATIKEYIND